jgi:hypothetical protein
MNHLANITVVALSVAYQLPDTLFIFQHGKNLLVIGKMMLRDTILR